METALAPLRAVIVRNFPELAQGHFRLLTAGWDSLAVDVDDRLIFKFPRDAEAEAALRREASLLRVIRPAVRLPVPELHLHQSPPLFSRHPKLPGEHLLREQYQALSDPARTRLAADLALFYAQLHGLDQNLMQAAGATPLDPWLAPEDILRRIWPVLPSSLHQLAEETITAWQDLAPDPHGTVYGFFDGHGWNMAFDHAQERLNGIYDFADSGFGPLHQEFVYSDMIHPDLTARLMGEYTKLTGLNLNHGRVRLLSGALRLWELADSAQDPEHLPDTLQAVLDWAGS